MIVNFWAGLGLARLMGEIGGLGMIGEPTTGQTSPPTPLAKEPRQQKRFFFVFITSLNNDLTLYHYTKLKWALPSKKLPTASQPY
jgi:hypothetical protein